MSAHLLCAFFSPGTVAFQGFSVLPLFYAERSLDRCPFSSAEEVETVLPSGGRPRELCTFFVLVSEA